MRLRWAAVTLVACAVAGCGGGSDESPAPPAPPHLSVAQRTYIAQMRSLCERASQAEATFHGDEQSVLLRRFDNYSRFARDLARVKPPAAYAREHAGRVTFARNMAGAMSEVRRNISGQSDFEIAKSHNLVAEGYGRDDGFDAELGLIDCIWNPDLTVASDAYPSTQPGPLAALRPRLNRICADNSVRVTDARHADRVSQALITAAGAERLARLIRRMPSPTDRAAEFGGWRDALTTVARLSASPNAAFRAQAVKTAAASRKTAAKLGLAKCAKP